MSTPQSLARYLVGCALIGILSMEPVRAAMAFYSLNDTNSPVFLLDPDSGLSTQLFSVPGNVVDLEYDFSNGLLFAATNQNTIFTYALSAGSGPHQLLRQTFGFTSLALNSRDQLFYSTNFQTDLVQSFDYGGSLVNTLTGHGPSASGLEFDAASDTLYWIDFAGAAGTFDIAKFALGSGASEIVFDDVSTHLKSGSTTINDHKI